MARKAMVARSSSSSSLTTATPRPPLAPMVDKALARSGCTPGEHEAVVLASAPANSRPLGLSNGVPPASMCPDSRLGPPCLPRPLTLQLSE
eukprot:9884958-Alexandrium_andersonii.AAC.1